MSSHLHSNHLFEPPGLAWNVEPKERLVSKTVSLKNGLFLHPCVETGNVQTQRVRTCTEQYPTVEKKTSEAYHFHLRFAHVEYERRCRVLGDQLTMPTPPPDQIHAPFLGVELEVEQRGILPSVFDQTNLRLPFGLRERQQRGALRLLFVSTFETKKSTTRPAYPNEHARKNKTYR